MASREELYQALRNADAAGDTDGARKLAAYIQGTPAEAAPAEPAKEEPFAAKLGRQVMNAGAGALRGAGSIGATLMWPIDKATDLIKGDREQSLSRNQERRQDMTAALRTMGADTDSLAFQAGKLGGEIAGTAGVGGAVANTLARAPGVAAAAPNLLNAIRTAGMAGGSMPVRMAGGAINGLASAGLVDPEQAVTGAVVGSLMPPAIAGAGRVGNTLGRVVSGPPVAPQTAAAVQQAQGAGYVIPPTQARPSLPNRLLEGAAGKISTAQNASARNQEVTNRLAAQAVGASDLTPQSLQAVRGAAQQAYANLAQVGSFQADQAFQQALANAGGSKALPGIANKEVDDLIGALSSQPSLDAQQTIESIKRLRFEGSANKVAQDPTKKALGQAQMKIANALEDVVDRNLQATGQQDLLAGYRAARQTYAKLYDIDKALSKSSGNVDASKVAGMLQRGRPLSGELRQIGEFAGAFPKAAQMPEKMGSLPQFSPLDVFGAGALGTVSGNPLALGLPLLRPAARAAALSPAIQGRLAAQPGANQLANLLADPALQQAVLRASPVLAADR
jgi:hypothetical protein